MRSHLVSYATFSLKRITEGRILVYLRIVPAALIPRPWDFPDPPPKGLQPPTHSVPSDAKAPATAAASTPTASSEKAVLTSSPPEAASGSRPSPAPAAHDSVPRIINLAPGSA